MHYSILGTSDASGRANCTASRSLDVVAGSAEALYLWLAGHDSLMHVVFGFFLPTLAGNVFGGTLLFAVLSYAQVREEIDER